MIHEWCGWPREDCPCMTPTEEVLAQVEGRVRQAIARARRSDRMKAQRPTATTRRRAA